MNAIDPGVQRLVAGKVTLQELQEIRDRAEIDPLRGLDFVIIYEELVEKRGLTLDEYQDAMYYIQHG